MRVGRFSWFGAIVLGLMPMAMAAEVAVTHGPILGRISANHVGVWARTSRPGVFRVRYGREPGRLDALSPPASTRLEADNTAWVLIEGLEADATYHYKVVVEGGADADLDAAPGGSFRTLPDADAYPRRGEEPARALQLLVRVRMLQPPAPRTPRQGRRPRLRHDPQDARRRDPLRDPEWRLAVRGLPRLLARTMAGAGRDRGRRGPRGGPGHADDRRRLGELQGLSRPERRAGPLASPRCRSSSPSTITRSSTTRPGRRHRAPGRAGASSATSPCAPGTTTSAGRTPSRAVEPIHFGIARLVAGSDILVDEAADFSRPRPGSHAAELHVHWGGPDAGQKDKRFDATAATQRGRLSRGTRARPPPAPRRAAGAGGRAARRTRSARSPTSGGAWRTASSSSSTRAAIARSPSPGDPKQAGLSLLGTRQKDG